MTFQGHSRSSNNHIQFFTGRPL